MRATRGFVRTAIFASLTFYSLALGAARPCHAQGAYTPEGRYLLASNDANLLATVNPPEVPTPTPSLPTPAPASESGWHFAVSPYVWFAGIYGNVGALGQEATVHVTPLNLLDNVDMGIMATADVRFDRIVIPVDFIWAQLSDSRAMSLGPITLSLNAKLSEDMLTPKIGYRVIDTQRIKVDALVGFRYWHLGSTLTLQPQVGNGIYQSANWADALGGARIQAMLTSKVVLTIAGDAGGGAANSDYQVVGVLGYQLKKTTLQAGWRYLHVNYRPNNGFVLDVGQSGLLLGVTIPLK